MRIGLISCFYLLFILVYTNSFSQKLREFSSKEVKEDLEFMKESIINYNPSLGYFHDISDFNEVYDSLYQSIDGKLTELELLPLIQRLAVATHEGHTNVGSSRDTVNTLFRGFRDDLYSFLPIGIHKYKDRVFVDGNFSPQDSIVIGDELLSINGDKIDKILKKLQQYVIADGSIEKVKEVKAVDLFQVYYYWFYDQPEHFEIEISKNNTTHKFQIPAITRDSMIYWRDLRYGEPKESAEPSIDDVYEFRIEQDSIAFLELKSFNYQLMKKYKIKPRKLYKEIFAELRGKKIKYLVLDLRDNGGGRKEYAAEILPYLMKKELKGTLNYTTSWKGKKKEIKLPKQNKRYFDGELYVFTNAYSFSNGSVIPMYAKQFGDAVIIGQETSTRYEGFAAGSRQRVILPNSLIVIDIPRYYYTYTFDTPNSLKNRGVIPDYEIEYSIDDRRSGDDLELLKFYEIIK